MEEGGWTAERLQRMTLGQIGAIAENLSPENRKLLALLEKDRRVGARRLALKCSRRFDLLEAEKDRIKRLTKLERSFWDRNFQWVAGVDEVGRGCLAGPVVAAAVILPPRIGIPALDDSKKLNPEKREELLREILEKAVAVGIGQVEAEEIDRANILQASLKAMRLALADLRLKPQQVLVDGHQTPQSPFPEMAVVDGDGRSQSIAAASVVAKVYRDRLMLERERQYPQYGFARHKGYGTHQHLDALQQHGPCALHRRSFRPVARLVDQRHSVRFLNFKKKLESSCSQGELERSGRRIRMVRNQLSMQELQDLRRIYRVRLRDLNDVGRRGESAAADFLTARGYAVLERGYRGSGGEIDLIAKGGDCLVFVEVKSSREGGWGHPEERVTRSKRKHLIRAAKHYLLENSSKAHDCRFDIIAVVLRPGEPEITHLENAFQAE